MDANRTPAPHGLSRTRQLSELVAVSKSLAAPLDLDLLLQQIVDTATELVGAELGGLIVWGEQGDEPEYVKSSGWSPPAGGRTVEEGVLGLAGRQGTPLRLDDVREHPAAVGFSAGPEEMGPFLAVPLTHQQQTLGTLFVGQTPAGLPFDVDDEEMMMAFAAQAAIAIDNAHLYAQVQQRMRELEALYHADGELYRHLELEEVLAALVDVAVDVLEADKSTLVMWDADRRSLVAKAVRGFTIFSPDQISFALEEGVIGRVAAQGQPMVVPDTFEDARVARRITDPEGIRSFIHVPIRIDGQVFAIFSGYYTRPRTFSVGEKRLFLALVQRAALAIENAQLYEQAQQVAALQERNRVALDLHDTVAQMLFSIGLEAQGGLERAENDAQLQQRLQNIRRLAARSSDELRSAIFALRSPHLARQGGLVDLLHEQVAEFQARAPKVAATLIVPPQLPCLPPPVGEAAYRIVREALNNARKHAHASTVVVSVYGGDDALSIVVQDDGVGLPTSVTRAGRGVGLHFGIATMRRLTEQAHGTFSIANNDDQGTIVRARFPLG